jgi:hypothetical protein
MQLVRKTLSFLHWERALPLTLIVVLIATFLANVASLSPKRDRSDTSDVPLAVFVHTLKSDRKADPSMADVILSAPDQAHVGDLIEIDASGSHGESYKWQVSGVRDGNFKIVDGGSRLLVAADKVGDITITVATAIAGTVDLKTRVIKIVERVDKAVDTVVDVIKPDNPKSLFQNAIEAVDVPNKAELVIALQDSFITVARMIEVEAITTPNEVIKLTKDLNHKALGEHAEAFKPVIAELERHVASLAKQGKLKTMEQHAKVWREIASYIR